MIARARSLDEIAGSIVMPIFLTYDSSVVAKHDVVSALYISELEEEATRGLETFEKYLEKPLEVEIRLILVPLESKRAFVDLLHAKLKALHEL